MATQRTHGWFSRRAGVFVAVGIALMSGPGGADTQVIQDPQQCFRYIDEPAGACSSCSSLCYGKGFKCCGIVILPT